MRTERVREICQITLEDKKYQEALLVHRDFSIKKKRGKVVIEANEIVISPSKVDVRA